LIAAFGLSAAAGCDRGGAPSPGGEKAAEEVALAQPAPPADAPALAASAAQPARPDSTKADPTKAEPTKADSTKADPTKADPARVVDEDDDDDDDDEPVRRASSRDDDDEPPSRARRRAKAPATEPRPLPAEEPGAVARGLRVKRLQFAGAIAGREPEAPRASFAASEDVYAFVEVRNTLGEQSRISVTFVSPKNTASKISLDVGDSVRWRTWAKRRVGKDPGTWHVVVRDSGGRELARGTFEVAP
jgi:hypothetical protein